MKNQKKKFLFPKKFVLLVLVFLFGYFTSTLMGSVFKIFKIEVVEKQEDERVVSWKVFSHSDYLKFKHPSEWKIRDSIESNGDFYYFFSTPDNYNLFKLSIIDDYDQKENRRIVPNDYYHPSEDDRLFEIKRSSQEVSGFDSVRILGNINAVQGWPSERLVIAVPQKGSLIIMNYKTQGLVGGAAEQRILEEFDLLVGTIDITLPVIY